MRLSSILGNSQKLDGGAMFGNAPKAMWASWASPDETNRIDLACRALLVETASEKVLFETGIGAYMAPKYKERFGVQEEEHILLNSLAELELTHQDITAVVLSHLHFDHAGGLLSRWQEGSDPELLFPNANYYVGKGAWERAVNPHPRDRASFVPILNQKLETSGRLVRMDPDRILRFDDLEVRFRISEGHTPGMICSDLRWNEERLVFAADLIPGRHWVHLPITMGYDRYPEKVIDEKKTLLTSLEADGGWLFYTHDAQVAVSQITLDPVKHKFKPGTSHQKLVRVQSLNPA